MNRLIYKCKQLFSFNFKYYSTHCIRTEEYTVSPFISLFITCPYNVKIRPLDVHKYPNCDKIIINLYCNTKTKANITCIHDNTRFSIFGESADVNVIDCCVETPVKSDINIITTQKGNIDIKKINGDKIFLQSQLGEIISHSCQTKEISYKSLGGNITTHGTLHAADIEVETKQAGKIDINHLQALKATVTSKNGDISVKSSYCDDTIFKTKNGKLYLDNIHKNCSIFVTKNGFLQMTGFDGTLTVDSNKGNIDIQASKLYDNSKISSKNKNSILLRLSDWIQENTQIKTTCQQLKVADDVKLVVENKNTCAVLTPKNSKFTSELEINSSLSNIDIEGASWSDMLKLKGINFAD